MADRKEEEKEDKKKEAPAAESEESEGEESDSGEAAGGLSGKKKLIMIVAIVVLAIGGIVAGLVLSGTLSSGEDELSEEERLAAIPKIVYFDLEEFLVNLNNPGKQTTFLKMSITLELPSLQAKQMVEGRIPRIRDSFQVYLRELRSSDLQGSAGLQRLREELLLRINKILEPEKVNDILFKEIIVQ